MHAGGEVTPAAAEGEEAVKRLISALMSFALFSCHPVPAGAADKYVARMPGLEIVLGDGKCEAPEVLAKVPPFVPPQVREAFREARINADGKPYKACWFKDPSSGHPFIFDEAGDAGHAPADMFAPVTTTSN